MKQIPIPPKDEIYNYYITQCHSIAETAAHYQVSAQTLMRWFKVHQIKKNRSEIEQTNLRLYGVPYATMSAEIQAKREQTCLDRYGCITNLQLPETQAQIRQTCLQRYGAEHPAQNIEVQRKIKETNMQKYGASTCLVLPDVKSQTIEKCRQQYGCDFYLQSSAIRQKIQKTNAEKYGSDSAQQRNVSHLDIWQSTDALRTYLESLDRLPLTHELAAYFNVSASSIVKRVAQDHLESLVQLNPARSRYEDDLVAILQSWGIQNILTNRRNILQGREIDIYLPDYHLGIEFNGDYWHSDLFYEDHNGRSTKHQEKSLAAEARGIFLFQIFEHEWNSALIQSNILNRLRTILMQNTQKVAARKCTVSEINPTTKGRFLNDNHIQGNDHSALNLGLYYGTELVACMTFAKPRSKKYTWELSRFCSKHGTVIQGGASKLFTHFLRIIQSGDTVVSYNDITKTSGKIYLTLGFRLISVNSPNYVWINFQTGDIRSRYQEKAAGEVERMHNAGYHRVCDCGTKTWVYTKS